MQTVSCQQLIDQFPALIQSSMGDLNTTWSQICSLESIQNFSLVFISNEKQLAQVLNSSASIVLAPLNLKDKISKDQKCWLFSKNPELAMREIKNKFILSTPYRNPLSQRIHPSASVSTNAQVDASAQIAAGAVISANVKVGENTYIGANSIIEKDVVIGKNTTIHPLVYIGHGTIIGDNCEILPQTTIASEGYGYAHDEKWNHYRIPHSGKVVLENDVHVGANCSIDRGTIEDTIIGQGTKIDNQCHLAHNSVVGKNCLITAQFGMAGSSQIGNNFVSGGKASVTGHVSITDNVQISGMSGVTKSIDKPGQYGGFPLQPLQDYLKTKAAMAQLHELRKTLQSFLKNKGNL